MSTASKIISIQKEAETELKDSVSFYRERGGEDLAVRFKKEVAEGFEAIIENPDWFPQTPEIAETRKYQLRHFPFSILYVNFKKEIWVVAVAHGSRRPGFWTDRLHY